MRDTTQILRDEGLGGQGGERFGRREAFCPLLDHHLPFLQPVHELDADQGALGGLTRFEPPHGTGDPLHAAMILFHQIGEAFHLPDDDRRAMRLVVPSDSNSISLTAVNRDLLWHAVTTDGLGEDARGHRLVPRCREENIDGLAALIHGAMQVGPLAFHPDVRLVHAPAAPHRPLAAVERRFERRALLQDPAVDGRVIDRYPALLHELFELAIAQRVRHIPPDAREDDVFLEMGPLKLTITAPPLLMHAGSEREIIPQMTCQGKFATHP